MEGKVAFILYNVLTPEECQHLIDKTEKMGYRPLPGYSPSYRSNTRVIVDDPDRGLTNELWRRLSPFVPDLAETRAVWRPYGLNERWRFCRYTPGQHFSSHFDGCFRASEDDKSHLTVMLYLNGGFEGGATVFLEGTKDRVQPVAGMALVFQHNIYHEGERLESGVKYIMRSDAMFQRFDTSS